MLMELPLVRNSHTAGLAQLRRDDGDPVMGNLKAAWLSMSFGL